MLPGRVSPGGRLPITIEKRWEDNPAHDNYYNNVFNDYRKETYLRIAYNGAHLRRLPGLRRPDPDRAALSVRLRAELHDLSTIRTSRSHAKAMSTPCHST
ncbi:MAG: hypothetical protein ACLUNS_00100 [Alistipes shahii]